MVTLAPYRSQRTLSHCGDDISGSFLLPWRGVRLLTLMIKRDTEWATSQASSLESIAMEWDSLVFRIAKDHPLVRSEFLLPLIHQFGDQKTLLATERDALGQLQSAAIFERHSLARLSTFCPAQLPLCPILTRDVRTLAEGLLACIGFASLSLLRFDPKFQPEPDPRQLELHAADYATTFAVECVDQDFATYWQNRSKSLRKNMKRHYNRIRQQFGGARYVVVTEEEHVPTAVHRYAEIESKGWKGREGSGLYVGSNQTKFYSECLSRFAAHGDASVHELYFDDRLVASRLCVRRNGVCVILKTTYDEEFSQFSPGTVLLHELLQHAFSDQNVCIVEFYTKAEPERLAWATETRNVRDITVYRNAIVGALAAAKRLFT